MAMATLIATAIATVMATATGKLNWKQQQLQKWRHQQGNFFYGGLCGNYLV
jgi:hypothetical protein